MEFKATLSVLMIITELLCYSVAVKDTNTDTDNTDGAMVRDDIEIEAETVNILRENKNCNGPPGPQGIQGPPGPYGPPGGGVIYTRWGRTVCPNTNGTELVYKGLAAGSFYEHYGGGANLLCLPEDMEYRSTTLPHYYSTIYAGEYESPVMNSVRHDDNIACAICINYQRSFKLMIPGKTSCPTSWTEEYEGYLMAGYHGHEHNYEFECVDEHAEVVAGQSHNGHGALFYHVGGVCNVGLPCPPMVANRPLTCVVCTK